MSEDRRSPTLTPRISKSFALYAQSATDNLVHYLVSLISLRGLRRLLFLAVMPYRICMHRISARNMLIRSLGKSELSQLIRHDKDLQFESLDWDMKVKAIVVHIY